MTDELPKAGFQPVLSFLDSSRAVAGPGFNRWLVVPAALAIHLCIGQIYAYSVFNRPLSTICGGTPGDWTLPELGWIFSIALFCLGASAAVFGKWVERSGPRRTMFTSALCFSGGFFLSALGVHLHQLWLVYLGHGVLGGLGLGLGYISPVSTLIKWFPDRPGMATGLAIMGFGGGAMIASPLSLALMRTFRTASSPGITETFLAMGGLYLCLMMAGALMVRVPPDGWAPRSVKPARDATSKPAAPFDVTADQAMRTRQYYLLLLVLMLNVTAGIGLLGQASVMIQEMFSKEAVGEGAAVTAEEAGAFVMLLSFFNMAGRFFWSSLSDTIGRRHTYSIFFLAGAVLYCLVPLAGQTGSRALFVGTCALIISMYGGGFATIPAYIRDTFGTLQVGAIHGRVLLGWSAAAVLGPVLVNYIRDYQIKVAHLPKAQAYSITMYVMAGLLVLGFIVNLMMKPVDPKYHHRESK